MFSQVIGHLVPLDQRSYNVESRKKTDEELLIPYFLAINLYPMEEDR